MANKKEEAFSYGSAFIPSGESRYSILRWGWRGLDRTDGIDSGSISDGSGVLVNPPYIDVAPDFLPYAVYREPIGVFGFDDFLLVLYREGGSIKVDYRAGDGSVYTGVMGPAKGTDEDFARRCVVQFNVATGVENLPSAALDRKLLIFPDRCSMDFHVAANFSLAYLGDAYPALSYAAVYGSRVFGVDDSLVYASSYNDYANWDLDTADESSDANAWVSMSQSNVKADGTFTAIAAYDNHVVLFKRDFMQLVYNNKNPFRVVDVTAIGAVSQYAVTETEGRLYFAGPDNIYVFTGGVPKAVGDKLRLPRSCFDDAAMGSYKDKTYLYAGGTLYTLYHDEWSAISLDGVGIRQFAENDNGLYALLTDGRVVQINGRVLEEAEENGGSDGEGGGVSYGTWWFVTDLMAAGKLDVRRVKKLSVLCDIAKNAWVEVYLLRNDDRVTGGDNPAGTLILSSKNLTGRKVLRGMVRMMGSTMHRLLIRGGGRVRLYAAELLLSWGGDLYRNEE